MLVIGKKAYIMKNVIERLHKVRKEIKSYEEDMVKRRS